MAADCTAVCSEAAVACVREALETVEQAVGAMEEVTEELLMQHVQLQVATSSPYVWWDPMRGCFIVATMLWQTSRPLMLHMQTFTCRRAILRPHWSSAVLRFCGGGRQRCQM